MTSTMSWNGWRKVLATTPDTTASRKNEDDSIGADTNGGPPSARRGQTSTMIYFLLSFRSSSFSPIMRTSGFTMLPLAQALESCGGCRVRPSPGYTCRRETTFVLADRPVSPNCAVCLGGRLTSNRRRQKPRGHSPNKRPVDPPTAAGHHQCGLGPLHVRVICQYLPDGADSFRAYLLAMRLAGWQVPGRTPGTLSRMPNRRARSLGHTGRRAFVPRHLSAHESQA